MKLDVDGRVKPGHDGLMDMRKFGNDLIASMKQAAAHTKGRKVRGMQVTHRAGEIGRVRVISDFLPAPAELVPREENVKVTLSLSRRSLDFFKREAKKRRVPYQRMIRALADAYVERQEERGQLD
jgi:predicted DNA binding CopG/RHH family protein